MERYCKICGERLVGRSDKRFCSDSCRSDFHNGLRSVGLRKRNFVESILSRNWNALDRVFCSGNRKIRLSDLNCLMFNKSFHTAEKRRFFRPTVYYCFNYKYYISLFGIVHIYDTSAANNDYLCSYNSANTREKQYVP